MKFENLKYNCIKLLGVVFMMIVCIFFCVMYKVSWINYYDKLYDIFLIIEYVSFAIMFVISVVIVIQSKKNKNKRRFLVLLALIFVNISVACLMFSDYGVEVTCVTNIIEVANDNNSAYLVVKNKTNDNAIKIKCDKIIADNILADENVLYEFDYRYFKSDDKNGVLGTIDICNRIDNR